jgi:HK97 gp10 family phage protein
VVDRTLGNGGMAVIAAGMRSKLQSMVYKIAALISAEAKHFSPIDTGRLRASIHIEPLGPLKYQICTNVYYAIYQEFGTSKMKAHPYMRPAAAKVRSMLPGIVKTVKVI